LGFKDPVRHSLQKRCWTTLYARRNLESGKEDGAAKFDTQSLLGSFAPQQTTNKQMQHYQNIGGDSGI
jgi:hypothetical protein